MEPSQRPGRAQRRAAMRALRRRADVLLLVLALALALGAGIAAAAGDEQPGAAYWDHVVGVNVNGVEPGLPSAP